jgi:hypothetical protein
VQLRPPYNRDGGSTPDIEEKGGASPSSQEFNRTFMLSGEMEIDI